jgi:cell division protease FtsH
MALGYTLSPPESDRLHETKAQLIDEIAMTMGGRAAEMIIFEDVSSGAANDIDQATRIAKYMVMEFGMSDLGPVNYGPNQDATQWGRSLSEQGGISQDVQAEIDKEVRKFVNQGLKRAVELLKKHQDKLELVTEELLKKETLEGEEFDQLMGGPKSRQ